MKKVSEDIITYTFSASSLTCISAEEIYEKFGTMFFYNDKQYELWCRRNMGGNESIHKIDDSAK